MNVYDFDGTIYDGDSSIDFCLFCFAKDFSLVRFLPKQFFGFLKFIFRKISRKEFKEKFFCFLKGIEDVEELVKQFWKLNGRKIKPWCLAQRRDDDIIISASPDFLLNEICKTLNVKLIATRMDSKTGKIIGENCRGAEKVNRLCAELKLSKEEISIENFYSDSKSDEMLAVLAKNSFLVMRNKIYEWK